MFIFIDLLVYEIYRMLISIFKTSLVLQYSTLRHSHVFLEGRKYQVDIITRRRGEFYPLALFLTLFFLNTVTVSLVSATAPCLAPRSQMLMQFSIRDLSSAPALIRDKPILSCEIHLTLSPPPSPRLSLIVFYQSNHRFSLHFVSLFVVIYVLIFQS